VNEPLGFPSAMTVTPARGQAMIRDGVDARDWRSCRRAAVPHPMPIELESVHPIDASAPRSFRARAIHGTQRELIVSPTWGRSPGCGRSSLPRGAVGRRTGRWEAVGHVERLGG